jgi:hypothetical protein
MASVSGWHRLIVLLYLIAFGDSIIRILKHLGYFPWCSRLIAAGTTASCPEPGRKTGPSARLDRLACGLNVTARPGTGLMGCE